MGVQPQDITAHNFWRTVRLPDGNNTTGKGLTKDTIQLYERAERIERQIHKDPKYIHKVPHKTRKFFLNQWPVLSEFKQLSLRLLSLEVAREKNEDRMAKESGIATDILLSQRQHIEGQIKLVKEALAQLEAGMNKLKTHGYPMMTARTMPDFVREPREFVAPSVKKSLLPLPTGQTSQYLNGKQWGTVSEKPNG
jgi:hypothetical protein